jgi:hypothetical protein
MWQNRRTGVRAHRRERRAEKGRTIDDRAPLVRAPVRAYAYASSGVSPIAGASSYSVAGTGW